MDAANARRSTHRAAMRELGLSRNGSQGTKKNDIRLGIVKTWCVPPEADADFVCHMEDVLEVYSRPYDPQFPVICLDEQSKQLIGEVLPPSLPKPCQTAPACHEIEASDVTVPAPERTTRVGQPAKIDYEYERRGTCNIFMMCEPLGGWRHVKVTEHRCRVDWAECVRELVDVHYPHATKILLVGDNLNTHNGASLYAAFPPAEARRILERVEFHYTPKHGSWLDMAECELSILTRQCLDRRMASAEEVAHSAAAWEAERNVKRCRIHWTFTLSAARVKMHRVYPKIDSVIFNKLSLVE
jgi:hypothetical protein